MNRDFIANVISHQVITATEVAMMLGVSRQQLSYLEKKGELVPVKKVKACDIYIRDDVVAYINNKDGNCSGRYVVPRHIYGNGSTRDCIEYISKKIDRDRVVAIYIYFHECDAINDGFYCPFRIPRQNELQDLSVPTFVLQFDDLEQIWFSGLNCNYSGAGPNGSYKVLKDIFGVNEEYAAYVYRYPIIKYYRENREWKAIYEDDSYDTNEYKLGGDFGTRKYNDSRMYLFNNKLVKLCHRNTKYWDNYDIELFVKQYLSFLPYVNYVTIYPRDLAIKTGHQVYSSIEDSVFQIVLSDGANRELWLNTWVDESIPLESNADLVNILCSLGFDIHYEEQKAENKFKKYFNEIFRRNAKIINYYERPRIFFS